MSGLPFEVVLDPAALFPWLFSLTVAGAVILLVAVACGRIGHVPARARVSVWRAAAGALLLLPFLLLLVSTGLVASLGIAGYTGQLHGLVAETASTRPLVGSGGMTTDLESATGEATAPSLDRSSEMAVKERPPEVNVARGRWLMGGSVGIWLLGALGLIAHLLAGLFTLSRHGRSAATVEPRLLEWARNTLAAAGRAGTLRVVRGGPFAVPVCWGFRNATILLPASSHSWSGERTRAVVMHEIAHLARRDTLFLALSRAATALHWFNPLAWVVQRALDRDTETVCDEMVLRAGVSPDLYARILVETAQDAQPRGRRGMLLAMGHSGSLERRIDRILATLGPPERCSAGTLGAVAVLLVTVAASLAAAPTRQGTPMPLATPMPPATPMPLAAPAQSDTVTRQEILDALILALEDRSEDVRRSAVNSLRDAGDPGALAALDAVRNDPSVDVGRAAEVALGIRPARANMVIPPSPDDLPPAGAVLDSLEQQLADPDFRVRLNAVRRLGNLEDPRSIPGLVDRFADVDFRVRGAAAAALGNIGERAAVPALVQRLADSHSHVRANAAAALGNIGEPRAVPGLVAAWPDPDDHVRMNLVSALGAIGERSGARPGLEGLRDGSVHVRRVSAEALGKLIGVSTRRSAPSAAPASGGGESRPAAPTPAGSVRDPAVRMASAASCEATPTTSGILTLAEAVTTLLEDPDPESRERAARAIGVLAPPPEYAFDQDARTEAAEPAPTAGKDHHHALVVGLSDPAGAVRVAAACSLVTSGHEAALEFLALRARDSEPESLRSAARLAIEEIEARAAARR